jgi:hypothetical protein
MAAVPLIGLTFWLLLIPAETRQHKIALGLRAEVESGGD